MSLRIHMVLLSQAFEREMDEFVAEFARFMFESNPFRSVCGRP